MLIWILILAALVLLIAVVITRTLLFKQLPQKTVAPAVEDFDKNKAVEDLRKLVRCRTVSYADKALEDEAEFDKLKGLLPVLYPAVYGHCDLIQPNGRALLFHWKGKDTRKPCVLMAHFDVVPVDEQGWSRPAFDALMENDVIWGRGTLDTKGTFCGILQAAEHLINEGFVPEHDIYLAFGGNEEVNGNGAPAIVSWFEAHDIHPDFVLDEGGAVVNGVFPGVNSPIAVVGIAEKGLMNAVFTVETDGGHASTPPAHTPVGILAGAAVNIEKHPFPFKLTAPAAKMFDTLGRRSGFLYRMIFANLWLFSPVLDMICKRSGGELNALVRTTVAFTQMSGSAAANVIPPRASMVANLRVISGETTSRARDRLQKLCKDDRIHVEVMSGSMDPSPVSDTDCEQWERLSEAIRSVWQDAVVSPYLMLACSDSRHYGKLSNHVYRFSAMSLSRAERAMIHGNDERVPVKTYLETVAFFHQLIRKC